MKNSKTWQDNQATSQNRGFPPLDVGVSVFPNALDTNPSRSATMREILAEIKDGKYKAKIEPLRALIAEHKEKEYDARKKRLPAFSMSAILTTRAKDIPLPEKLRAHSNLLQIDIDKIHDLEAFRQKIQMDQHVLFCFLSASARGLKIGIRIDGTRHEESFLSARAYFKAKYDVDIDPKVKEVVRLCFVSFDPDLFINESAKILPVSNNGTRPKSHNSPQGRASSAPADPGRKLTHGERALETAKKIIEQSVDGEKLNVLLKAGELLGGYVAGGILSEEDAKACLRAAIEAKPNVNNLDAAYKAIEDSLRHGQQSPIEFEDLERQRLEYLSTSSKSGVLGVPGVPANTGASLARNTEKNAGVPGVPESFPDEAERQKSCYRVYEDWCGPNGKDKPGVYYHAMSKETKDKIPSPVDQWICDPLYVDAITRDSYGGNHGLMLRFRNKDSDWKLWNMPARLLDGGDEMRKELLGQGLFLDIKNKAGVPVYINSQHPKARMRAALQVGWHENDFVLPDRVIGTSSGGEAVFFQSEEAGVVHYSTRGSLDDWRTHVAALCVGNPLLTFTISASFAGPLLRLCNIDGAGFHIFGDSSSGKTTCCKVAAATWGEWKEYMRSWKATANGLEGAACLFNDGLLVLDEMGDGDGREIERTVYALGNGKGKQRAHVTGSAKAVRSWRILTLSNGEKTLEAQLAACGITTKAGQLVRLLQLPVFGKYGAFDDLHGYSSGKAFSNALVAAASKYYGTPGIAFLEKLTAIVQGGEDISEDVKAIADLLTKDDLSSQEDRAATAFALVAAAGEIATKEEITGWKPGAAIDAAKACFTHWRNHRGKGDAEKTQILTMLSDFISQWGDARFSDVEDYKQLHGARAGYWRDTPKNVDGDEVTRREWLLTSAGLREAVKGFDVKRITSVLLAAGWLSPGGEGKSAQSLTVQKKKSRFYVVTIPEDNGHAA